ncbi:MAG: low molecular weight phosphatase family protein [Candidatus Eisenbacteria bacterium]
MHPQSNDTPKAPSVLFLCTGNYYRSRFAEAYFRHLASERGLAWEADSSGLRPDPRNEGNLSIHTVRECQRLDIPIDARPARVTAESDFHSATHVVAVKESEHRPLMRELYPDWENRIEYWEVHDLDVALPGDTLARLRAEVERLVSRLAGPGAPSSRSSGDGTAS